MDAMTIARWTSVVRQALTLEAMTLPQTKATLHTMLMRDLEKLCPDAWRALVRASK